MTTPITKKNLKAVSDTSSIGNYVSKNENSERVSQGLPSKDRDAAKTFGMVIQPRMDEMIALP
ncbi:unnamed protein product [Clonostachys rosea]|uniref:Uncharacterized protein n=1 Tax=Bionectria ochroleuca TaxID=29856 RepID=A0ABY6ULX1_BIOOC|nr:unnamed protein product [Clonostachys rosea]